MNSRNFIKNILLLLVLPLLGCGNDIRSSRREFALGTLCQVDLYGGNSRLFDRLFNRLREIEEMMSAALVSSELSRVNELAGIEALPVSPELFTVLERALYFAKSSDGAFDPTVGPLVKLWDIGGDYPRVPSGAEIQAALALVDWRELELSGEAPSGTAFLRRTGMSLDLGAAAKGFAADELVHILRENKVKSAIIDLGGNIYVYGTKPVRFMGKKTKWRIGIQNPLDDRGVYTGFLELDETSVVTSGVYERFFVENEQRYHHILDTASGYPVENGLLSVTIALAPSMNADALSTAVFALGYEKGRALAETNNALALFVFDDKTIRGSRGTLEIFTLIDESFRIVYD